MIPSTGEFDVRVNRVLCFLLEETINFICCECQRREVLTRGEGIVVTNRSRVLIRTETKRVVVIARRMEIHHL